VQEEDDDGDEEAGEEAVGKHAEEGFLEESTGALNHFR
jgi:hypothetical protein